MHLLVVQDLADADLLPHRDDFLAGMLAAVSLGFPTVDRRTWERECDPLQSRDGVLRHVPAAEKVLATVCLAEEFVCQHERMNQLFKIVSARPRSLWRVREGLSIPADETVHHVRSLSDVAAFIRRVRRFERSVKCVGGTLFPGGWTARSSKPKPSKPRAQAKSVAAKALSSTAPSGGGKKSLRELFQSR